MACRELVEGAPTTNTVHTRNSRTWGRSIALRRSFINHPDTTQMARAALGMSHHAGPSPPGPAPAPPSHCKPADNALTSNNDIQKKDLVL